MPKHKRLNDTGSKEDEKTNDGDKASFILSEEGYLKKNFKTSKSSKEALTKLVK